MMPDKEHAKLAAVGDIHYTRTSRGTLLRAVLGNREYESGKQAEVQRIFTDAGIIVLDGDAHELYRIGFAGVKGFAGGFGQHALQAGGEDNIKRFVHESVNETLKLELIHNLYAR